MDYENQIANIFSLNGELSQNIKGFRPRAEQLEMAHAVGKAIQNKSSLVVEAGTGTGKTFAYLAPALVFGKKPLFLQDLKIFKISFLIEICLLLKKPLISREKLRC
ncbi:probable ATP-dependent helicase [Haemophilus influenzae 22.1-21]|nr:probable ATP-dependent helicase [Haemophilus influenzae 22.1-21]